MTSALATSEAATPAISFRVLLQSELARRCTRNPQYSLRAFAAHLGVDHSTLSQWLRGRRPITGRAVEALGRRLGLTSAKLRPYVARASWDGLPQRSHGAAKARRDLAILELMRLDAFQADSRWIARVLDMTVDEVNVSLQRLIRLGLLDMVSPDQWIGRSAEIGAVSSPVPPVERSSVTVAVNSAMLQRAFERVARFRQELLEILQDGDMRDDVYQVEIALFPVTTFTRTS